MTYTCDRGYTVGGLATLTSKFTRICLFDGSFSQTVSVSFCQVHFNEVRVIEGVVGRSLLCLIILVRQVLSQSPSTSAFVAWLKIDWHY